MAKTFLAEATDFIEQNDFVSVRQNAATYGYDFVDGYVLRTAYDEIKAKLASAEYELAQSRKLALMAKVERDTAVSERNMALQALVKMVETRLVASREAAAKAEINSPGGRALNAISVTQDVHRVR